MRGFIAIFVIALFAAGIIVLSLAFSHPGAAILLFVGGIAMITLALLIPLQLLKED